MRRTKGFRGLVLLVVVLALLATTPLGAAAGTQPAAAQVTIEGSAAVGQTLSAKVWDADGGELVPEALIWQREGDQEGAFVDIAGATESSYLVSEEDIGSRIRVCWKRNDGSMLYAEPTQIVEALAQPQKEKQGEPVRVTLTLVGDTPHGAAGHTAYQTWIHEAVYTVPVGTTALSLTEQVFLEKGYRYTGNGYIASVTTPGGLTLAGGDNGSASGWMYAVNGEMAMVGAGEYTLSDGDSVLWFYVDDYMADGRLDGNDVTADSDVPLPDFDAQWPSYRGNEQNNGVVNADTPRGADEAALAFFYALKDPSDWQTNLSDPLLVDGKIYVAAGDALLILDDTGKKVASGTLASPVGYTCRMLYADGKVIVPLGDGRVQALAADSLKTVWLAPAVTDKEGAEQQPLTTLTAKDGYVYQGTAVADWSSSYRGTYRAIELATGTVVWNAENQSAGYYWSGAAFVGDAVLYGGDDGILRSMNAKSGAEIDTVSLGSAIRSTVVLSGSSVYVTTTDGVLHQVTVNQDGSLGAVKSCAFAASSTGTAAIYDGKAYVGGSLGEAGEWRGIVAQIDVKTMKVTAQAKLPAEVKSAPLISTGYTDGPYVYLTANAEPGGVYVWNPAWKQAQALFSPEGSLSNYCMASVIAAADGTLYYTNDSGALFAVAREERQPAAKISVSVSVSEGGNANPSGVCQVNAGGSLTVQFTPDDGWRLRAVYQDGEKISHKNGAVTLLNLQKDTELYGEFEKIPDAAKEEVTVTISAGEGGTVSPVGEVRVKKGGSLTLTIKPKQGYQLAAVTVDGKVVLREGSTYTLRGITKEVDVRVTFSKVEQAQGVPETDDAAPLAETALAMTICLAVMAGLTLWYLRRERQK